MNRRFEDYSKKVLDKYGSWENNINSNVLYFYKFIDKIDRGIVDFLIKLNNHGSHTVFSCSGHSENSIAYVIFASYVTKDKVLRDMQKLFNANEDMFYLEKVEMKTGVSLLKINIPCKYKEYFNIVSYPREI